MACDKWETTGLLFSSGELDVNESEEFEKHMLECSECAYEYETYRKEREQFFTTDILYAQPSKACDEEILRVCSDGRRKVANFRPFSLLVKRTLVSVALFIVGFSSVGYITFKMNGARLPNTQEVAETIKTNNSTTDTAQNASSDSVNDTTPANNVNFAKTRGNLELRGVYPVDLQNK